VSFYDVGVHDVTPVPVVSLTNSISALMGCNFWACGWVY